MAIKIVRRSFDTNTIPAQVLLGIFAGLILGAAFKWFPPIYILGGLVLAFLLFAILKRPEVALLGILVATSSIVYADQLPRISLGISLHISDVLLLILFGIIFIRGLVEPGFKLVHTPLDLPLLIFYSLMLLSTFIAINNSSLDVVEARRMIRYVSYYLTFFIVTNLVRDRRQLDFLLNSIFLLATIVAVAMLVQFLVGDSVQIIPGRVETLGTQGVYYDGIVRISPPGFSIVVVSFITLFCIFILEKLKLSGLLKFLQCGLLGMALLVTFLRSFWAVLILVLFLLVYIFRGHDRQKLIGWGLAVIFSMIMILLVVFSDSGSKATRIVGAFIDRLSTLGNSGTFQGQDDSVTWRTIENGYAFSAIASHPMLGLGLGARYRPFDPRIDSPVSTYDFRRHIHNSHLWILLDSGFLGYLSFLWLSLAFLIRGFRFWRNIADSRLRGVMLGFTLVYLAVLVAGATNSTFMQGNWIPVIGVIIGINEVILIKARHEVLIA